MQELENKVFDPCDNCCYHYELTKEEIEAINQGKFDNIRGFGCESIDRCGFCILASEEEGGW